MNYKDLSFEERMQKAAEYALILVSDDRPGLDVINELKDVFGFSESEAKECYLQMRKRFDEQFKTAIRSKIRFAWIAMISSTLIFVFFGLMSAGIGWGYLIYTFLFGLILIGSVSFLATYYREKATSPESAFVFDRERKQKNKLEKDGEDWTMGLPLILLLIATIAFYLFYTRNNVLDTNDLYRKYDMIISDKVRSVNVGSRSSHYIMIFRFRGFENKFEFDEKYYKYGKEKITSNAFSVGDTVAIETSRNDAVSLQDSSPKNIEMTNLSIGQGDDWLIDQEYRNKRIEQLNKKYFMASIIGFVICLIAVFIWIRFRKVKSQETDFVHVDKIYRHNV